MGQRKVDIQEVVLRQVFLDAFNDKEYTTTMQLRDTLRKQNQSIGKTVADMTLHSQVSNTLKELRKKGAICKPRNSTPQDGKWTMSLDMIREFRNRFVRRKYYKHKYCNHLETKKVVLPGWDYEITECRCPIMCTKIGNPEDRCDILHGSIYRDGTWNKFEFPVCPGYTKNKSTTESRLISWNMILSDVKKEIKDLVLQKIRRNPQINLEPEIRSYLPYKMRDMEISSILNFQELGLIQEGIISTQTFK